MNPYVNYDNDESRPFLYLGDKDVRLPQNEKVVGIKLDSLSKAYPYSITTEKKVINDNFSDNNIVIFHIPGTVSSLDQRNIEDSKDVGSTGVFNRNLDDFLLSFKYKDEKIVDEQTNSVWSITGDCIGGKLQFKKLARIPHGDYFSFAWFAFRPNSVIYMQ